jgi:hypothetical protein
MLSIKVIKAVGSIWIVGGILCVLRSLQPWHACNTPKSFPDIVLYMNEGRL